MSYIDYKQKYTKFLKATRYMAAKRLTIKGPNNKQWQDLVATYLKKIVEPLEAAWQQLTKQEKGYFRPSNKKIERRQYGGPNISEDRVPF